MSSPCRRGTLGATSGDSSTYTAHDHAGFILVLVSRHIGFHICVCLQAAYNFGMAPSVTITSFTVEVTIVSWVICAALATLVCGLGVCRLFRSSVLLVKVWTLISLACPILKGIAIGLTLRGSYTRAVVQLHFIIIGISISCVVLDRILLQVLQQRLSLLDRGHQLFQFASLVPLGEIKCDLLELGVLESCSQ